MTGTVTPLATAARGRGKAATVTRREADVWLKREHPQLSRSARENLASAVPSVQRAYPDMNVWEWLDSAARLARFGYRSLTRVENPTMRAGLALARKAHLADEFDAHRRDGERS